ncbi:MAG: type IV secretory system conjugative DNA transfer family protein [Asticcacaulis sp.]|uniref:type IV secretory system conjugative DNA transfer family protein n=1 Tax=Asticcacaulis sp. TaxID=1872648 RepID=UPI003F7C0BFD
MSDKLRPYIAAFVVVVYVTIAATLALWAAGALFFIMHRSLPHAVTPLTWLTYAHFYWRDAHQRRLLLLSILAPGAIALFPLGAIFSALAGKERELHGSARFATRAEVRKAGLTGSEGIIVGKYEDRFLQFPGQQFVLLAAPTRSGKGVSFVIPNLLNWPDSCVVLDIKLENFLLTSAYRARHGQKVFLFNPYAEDGRTHRWNPLDGVSRDPNLRVGDLLTLATSLYPANPGDKDAFWADSARNLFLGLALMVMETPELPTTIGEILRQSGGKGRGLKDDLTDRLNHRNAGETPYSSDCMGALNRFLGASENTLANIISSFTAPLVPFANPLVDAATSASDFDIGRVRDEKMTIYIGIQPNRLADASLLLNLLFSQLINVNTRELPSQDRHPIPCLLILDEFPALGKIGVIARANAFIAGYGLRLLTIIQSVAQLEGVYGPHDARTLITNHAMQVLFTPREQRDAAAYSEMLGAYTVKSTSTGRSISRGFGAGGSNSENVSDQRRALLLPQELKELPDDEQIIVLENTRPIRSAKARFFREAAFIDRLKAVSRSLHALKGLPSKQVLDKVAFEERELSVSVPKVDIDGHIARVEQRLRPLTLDDPIDLSRLNVDMAALPAFVDPQAPSDAEVEQFVDAFFALGDSKPEPVELRLRFPEAEPETKMLEA